MSGAAPPAPRKKKHKELPGISAESTLDEDVVISTLEVDEAESDKATDVVTDRASVKKVSQHTQVKTFQDAKPHIRNET